MADIINLEVIKERIAESNRNAKNNPNLYPIQEQATLMEIWEYVPCECDRNCTCKRFGCTHHYKLKIGITNDDILRGFLRMFVNKRYHERLKNYIDENDYTSELPPRVKEAREVFNCYIIKSEIYKLAPYINKTLLCNWNAWSKEGVEILKKIWGFHVRGSVYDSKINCILFPDICVPFDTHSRGKIQKELKEKISSYFDMLNKLRTWTISFLEAGNHLLSDLRKLDNCEKILPFCSDKISLPKERFDYGSGYFPEERPISRIIDKCFYKPSKEKAEETE